MYNCGDGNPLLQCRVPKLGTISLTDTERRVHPSRDPSNRSRLLLTANDLLDLFGAGDAVPGSGSANALIAALAAEVVRSIAFKTQKRDEPRYLSVRRTAEEIIFWATKTSADLRRAVDEDANDFAEVIALRRERDESSLFPEIAENRRLESLRREVDALQRATAGPLQVARLAVDIAERALTMFDHGFQSARGESLSACNAALSAAGSSAFVATVNLRDIARRTGEIQRNEDLVAWVESATQEVAAIRHEERRLRRLLTRRLSGFRKEARGTAKKRRQKKQR